MDWHHILSIKLNYSLLFLCFLVRIYIARTCPECVVRAKVPSIIQCVAAAMHCHFILIFLTYYDGDDEEDIDNGDNGVCVGKPKKK